MDPDHLFRFPMLGNVKFLYKAWKSRLPDQPFSHAVAQIERPSLGICYTYLKKALTKRVLVLVKPVNQEKYQDYQPSSGL